MRISIRLQRIINKNSLILSDVSSITYRQAFHTPNNIKIDTFCQYAWEK